MRQLEGPVEEKIGDLHQKLAVLIQPPVSQITQEGDGFRQMLEYMCHGDEGEGFSPTLGKGLQTGFNIEAVVNAEVPVELRRFHSPRFRPECLCYSLHQPACRAADVQMIIGGEPANPR